MADASEHPAAVRDRVVIGASAGGVAALRTIASQLPADFPAAILVVLHIGSYPSRLPRILDAVGPNPAQVAVDGERLQPGHIVVAESDHHLLVEGDVVRLHRGPKEHHSRPAIDPLFRSAALAAGPRVIGVVLSGCNGDGAAGLQAVKSCGGVAVVQDPEDADEPAMPRRALAAVDVDHCIPLHRMAAVLTALAGSPVPSSRAAPAKLQREHAISLGQDDPMEHIRAIGRASGLVCPDCSGTLFQLKDTQPPRYLCHTGHAFTIDTLAQAQNQATELALWSAIRALKEKEELLKRIAELDRIAGDERHADRVEAQARELADQTLALRRLVESG